jgi:hypothetical protein
MTIRLLFLLAVLGGCSSADQENMAIWQADQHHEVVCVFHTGVC